MILDASRELVRRYPGLQQEHAGQQPSQRLVHRDQLRHASSLEEAVRSVSERITHVGDTVLPPVGPAGDSRYRDRDERSQVLHATGEAEVFDVAQGTLDGPTHAVVETFRRARDGPARPLRLFLREAKFIGIWPPSSQSSSSARAATRRARPRRAIRVASTKAASSTSVRRRA